jgi:hypothetical protein
MVGCIIGVRPYEILKIHKKGKTMPTYRNSADQFYDQISTLEDVTPKLKILLRNRENGFYEVCQKFANIGLNAFKGKNKDLTVNAIFQYKDIKAAEGSFISFVKENNIKEIDEVLKIVRMNHSYAVEWDDSRPSQSVLMNEDGMIKYGKYIDFAELPDDQWKLIENEIIEMLKK